MDLSNIIAIIITILNLILLVFLIARFRWNKYEEAVVKRLRKEVSLLITELNRVTDRNITLVEDSIQRKKRSDNQDNKDEKNQYKKKSINKVKVETHKSHNKFMEMQKNDKEQEDSNNNKDYSSFYQKTSYNTYNKFLSKNNDMMARQKDINNKSNSELL